ncbi:MAG: hypothetical protein SFU56_03585 [Capsulimonadales bacterium]|nr:hypothetical protein [Capsulimonadales bacterium]
MTLPTMIEDERPVEEVRCAETGVPLSAIPAWYATVNVKFVSNAAKKAAASYNNMVASELEGRAPIDGEAEPALEDIEIDELELEEIEPDAEEE